MKTVARTVVGLFYTHAEATGDITGFTLARPNNPSGELDLNGDSIAAYWTHFGASGWYVDAIAMVTWLNGDATSNRGIGADLGGNVFAASLEGGYPFALGSGWTLEPQAQVIWQYIDLDDTSDPFTSIDYDSFDAFTGRIGARLEANLQLGTMPLQPFLDVNLWHNFSATDTIVFNTTAVALESEGTLLELGGGISAQVTPALSLYGEARYGIGLDDDDAEIDQREYRPALSVVVSAHERAYRLSPSGFGRQAAKTSTRASQRQARRPRKNGWQKTLFAYLDAKRPAAR